MAGFASTWWLPILAMIAFIGYSLFRKRPDLALQPISQATQQEEQLQQLVERAQAADMLNPADSQSGSSDNNTDEDNRYLQ